MHCFEAQVVLVIVVEDEETRRDLTRDDALLNTLLGVYYLSWDSKSNFKLPTFIQSTSSPPFNNDGARLKTIALSHHQLNSLHKPIVFTFLAIPSITPTPVNCA